MIFLQCLETLNLLAQKNIYHRDIKTKNLFLKNKNLKIGDFGVSKKLEEFK